MYTTDRVYHSNFGFGSILSQASRTMTIVRFDEETHGEQDFRVLVTRLEPATVQIARRAA
jgi:hypothetical protein